MHGGGQQLRKIRESLGLTVRRVQELSEQLASKHNNPQYFIDKARLSDIEAKGILPSIFKAYALAAIYHQSIATILSCFDIQLAELPDDSRELPLRLTHAGTLDQGPSIAMPAGLEETFDLRKSSDFGRMITQWGTVPLRFLAPFEHSTETFGYIGTEDWTMYPLLLPGSFVLVDSARRKVASGPWTSEYERPIYMIETREKMICGWCAVEAGTLVVQPHPLSPERVRIFRFDVEAEIVGQVVGVAMRLDSRLPQVSRASSTARTASTPDVREDMEPDTKVQ